ncbi:MAG: type II toxin-antitoxin system HicB family antitoxin [Blautia sp.]|nr:type II toxin-antitoxin system HicB family antitoxin [Blautia sp.]
MKFIYPAVISPKDGGGFIARFPDLVMCEAEGETLDEAIERANEAANDWISLELSEDEPALPPVTDLEDLILAPGETARNISINIRFYDGWDE